MREKDSALRAARRVHPRWGKIKRKDREKRTTRRSARSLARVPQIVATGPGFLPGLSEGARLYTYTAGGDEGNLSNKYRARNGRMNAGKNHGMTNCGGSFSGALAFSSRGFQRIFERCITAGFCTLAGISLYPFSHSLFLATAVLAKRPSSKLRFTVKMHQARLVVVRWDTVAITEETGDTSKETICSIVLSFCSPSFVHPLTRIESK